MDGPGGRRLGGNRRDRRGGGSAPLLRRLDGHRRRRRPVQGKSENRRRAVVPQASGGYRLLRPHPAGSGATGVAGGVAGGVGLPVPHPFGRGGSRQAENRCSHRAGLPRRVAVCHPGGVLGRHRPDRAALRGLGDRPGGGLQTGFRDGVDGDERAPRPRPPPDRFRPELRIRGPGGRPRFNRRTIGLAGPGVPFHPGRGSAHRGVLHLHRRSGALGRLGHPGGGRGSGPEILGGGPGLRHRHPAGGGRRPPAGPLRATWPPGRAGVDREHPARLRH